jgi:hypothetical protein
LSYTPMPAGCMIYWLYNHDMPMADAIGRSYCMPAVYYCHTLQYISASCLVCPCALPVRWKLWTGTLLLPCQSMLVICRSYGMPAVSYCHTLLEQPGNHTAICRLYNTVIQYDDCRMYRSLVAQLSLWLYCSCIHILITCL